MTQHDQSTRRRILRLAAAALAAPLLLTRAALAPRRPSEIKARGKVVIGIQGDNPPWGFVNSTGKQDGFDADISALFAKELGVPVEFVPLAVANRIPALTSGRVDMLFATMAMLPERAKAVQFSKPYGANIITLIAPKDDRGQDPRRHGQVRRSALRAAARRTPTSRKNAPAGTTIRRFDGDAPTIQALLSGQVQAVGGNIFYIPRLNEGEARRLREQARVHQALQRRLHTARREGDQRLRQRLHRQDQGQWRIGEDLSEVDEQSDAGLPRQHSRAFPSPSAERNATDAMA